MPTNKPAPKKKAKAKTPERSLTLAEEFFIQKNYLKEGVTRLSQLLGVPEALITTYIGENKALFENQEVNRLPGTHFATNKGVVSMTAAQAQQDDKVAEESAKEEKEKGRQAFMATLKNNIHIIDPNLPVG